MAVRKSFVCPHCGKEHEGLPTDWGYKKPDEVHALPYLEEYRRVRCNTDLCTLDDSRYFIRGVLPLYFRDSEDYFAWGIWVEVSREDHDTYLEHFNDDASSLPRLLGRIANAMPGYENTVGERVEVQLGKPDQRPMFWLPANSRHQLAEEQKEGISSVRHHELLKACGYFDGK